VSTKNEIEDFKINITLEKKVTSAFIVSESIHIKDSNI